jgi:D-lactate dehydrogenase
MSMESRKICFVSTEPEEEELFIEKFAGYNVSFEASLRDVPEDVEILSIFINDRIDGDFLDRHPSLRMIATRSMGFDHIDLEACTRRQIGITHVSGYGENTVAEHTFALMLALSRRIRESTEAALAGKFTHEQFRGMDLRGSTLGVVGAGRVGLHVIRIAGAFGMKVLAYDAHPNPLHTELLNFQYTTFEHLIRESHVITLHIPLNQETHHIFDRETISRCRPGVLIVNTARGRLIDSEALIEALDNGQVGGAGLDVIEEEGVFHGGATALLGAQIADRVRGAGMDKDRISLPAGRMKEISRYIASNALLRRAKVVFTPHNAYNSTESREFISNTTAENIFNYLAQPARTAGP